MVIDQGSPWPMLVFYIPRFQKTFPEFSGDLPLEKMKSVPPWRIELRILVVIVIPTFTLDHGYL
jgi:hypothetical protein